MVQVLALGVAAAEFDEVPVRHNEDKVNAALAKDVRWKLPQGQGADDPHAKANLLLQVWTRVCNVASLSGGLAVLE